MYRIVLWQGETAHYVMNPTSQTANLERYAVTSATLSTQVNGAGVLTFTVYDSHPEIAALKAAVNDQTYHVCAYRVEEDQTNTLVFNGRVYTWSYSPLEDQSEFVCEDFYAKLNDYIVRPYHYAGTVRGYLEMLLDNSGEFLVVGDVTVSDANDYIIRSNENATTLWDEISSKCIGSSIGGFIEVRDDERTVDWLAAPRATTDQVLAARSQLLTLTREEDTTEAFSVVYPFGADTGTENEYGQKQRLTLAGYDVAGNLPSGYTWYSGYNAIKKDSIYDVVGWRAIVATYDDVTTQSSLLTHAIATLDAQGKPPVISVSAVDLSDAGFDVQTLEAGCSVQISADGVSTTRMLTRVSRDLLDPASSSFEFGELDSISGSGGSGGSGGGGSTTSPHFWHTEVTTAGTSHDVTGFSTLPLEDVLSDVEGRVAEIDGGAVWLNEIPTNHSGFEVRANQLNARIVSSSMTTYENALIMTGISATLAGKNAGSTTASVQVDGYNGAVNVSGDTNVTGNASVTGHVTSNELTYTSGGGESQLSNPNHNYRICVTSAGNLRRDSSSNGGTSWTSAGYYANSGIAASVNSTISEIVTQTTTQAGNYTISAASFAQWGRMVQVVITIQPTAAVSAGASMSIGTIVSGKRPTLLAVAGSTYMHGGITTAGAISMRCRTAMTAGTSYNIAATYILA